MFNADDLSCILRRHHHHELSTSVLNSQQAKFCWKQNSSVPSFHPGPTIFADLLDKYQRQHPLDHPIAFCRFQHSRHAYCKQPSQRKLFGACCCIQQGVQVSFVVGLDSLLLMRFYYFTVMTLAIVEHWIIGYSLAFHILQTLPL